MEGGIGTMRKARALSTIPPGVATSARRRTRTSFRLLSRPLSSCNRPMSVPKAELSQRLLEPGVVAILRADSSAGLMEVTEALVEGGITAVEVTMTTPNALHLITEVVAGFAGRVLMGVGT